MFAFSRSLVPKANIPVQTILNLQKDNSESAKDLARISVFEEKLDLWWKLQFGAQDSKI